MITRICKTCKADLPWSAYPPGKGYADGIKPHCRECFAQMQKTYRTKIGPDQRKQYRLRSVYNLSVEELDAMREAQGGNCAVCVEPLVTEHIDHCHTTGKVRGLLCRHCNIGLGHFNDSPKWLVAAADYLTRRA